LLYLERATNFEKAQDKFAGWQPAGFRRRLKVVIVPF